jgi:hypothetical protein
MDLTPKLSITPGWSIFYCCKPASSYDNNDDNDDDGYDGFLWSAPSIKVVTLGGSKDFFGGSSEAAAETPTTTCSSDDNTDDCCYSFNVVHCSSPPSNTTAPVVQQPSEVVGHVPQQTTPDKTPCEPSELSCSDPSTSFIGIVEIITPKSKKLQQGYEIKRTSKFINTTEEEEGSVTSKDDDDDISNDDQEELMHHLYNIDQDSFDEKNQQSPIKYDTSNVEENEINDIIELPTNDAMSKLGLLHYFNRSAFSDTNNTNKGDTNEDDELSDEDEFYDSLESLGDEDSDDDDDDSSTNNTTQQTRSSPPRINTPSNNNNNQKREFRTMTTRELQFVDMSFEVIPSLKKND